MIKRQIQMMMMAVEKARKALMQPYFINLGLTVGEGQPRILNMLLKHGSMTQRELADACHLDVTTLSRTIDRMAGAGLLSREPHGSSRRAYAVVLTSLGREKAAEVSRGFQALDEILCRGFTPQQMEQLYELLKQMEQNLKQAEDAGELGPFHA